MNTKPRTRASHHAGKPNGRRGTDVGLHPIFFDWIEKPVLHQGRITYLSAQDDLALRFCRALLLACSAGTPFGSIQPGKARRAMIVSARADLKTIVPSSRYEPAHPLPIFPLRLDWMQRLIGSDELHRTLRVYGAEILLVEAGLPALEIVRQHLGDWPGAIICPTAARQGQRDGISLHIEVAGQNNFELRHVNGDTILNFTIAPDGKLAPIGSPQFNLHARLSAGTTWRESANLEIKGDENAE